MFIKQPKTNKPLAKLHQRIIINNKPLQSTLEPAEIKKANKLFKASFKQKSYFDKEKFRCRKEHFFN